jgi:hypothetical protein
MASDEAAERGQGDAPVLRRDLVVVVRDQVSPAVAAHRAGLAAGIAGRRGASESLTPLLDCSTRALAAT